VLSIFLLSWKTAIAVKTIRYNKIHILFNFTPFTITDILINVSVFNLYHFTKVNKHRLAQIQVYNNPKRDENKLSKVVILKIIHI
jgi:hypothetical protein